MSEHLPGFTHPVKTLALVPMFALAAAGPAHGHLVATPQGGLAQVEKAQQRNHAHAVYVARHGTGKVRRWHQRAVRWTGRELRETQAKRAASLTPRAAICHVFGAWCAQAISVAHCETGGTFSVYARNGQYLGLFQMGAYARGRFGHSWTALGQSQAAYRYFREAGWAPWECQP